MKVVWKEDEAYIGRQRIGRVVAHPLIGWKALFGVGRDDSNGWHDHWIAGDLPKDKAKKAVEDAGKDMWVKLHGN